MKQNKILKVLSTAALTAAIVAPVAAPVSAASTYTVSNVQSVGTNSLTNSRVVVEIPSGSLGAAGTQSSFRLRLPVDAAATIGSLTNVNSGTSTTLTSQTAGVQQTELLTVPANTVTTAGTLDVTVTSAAVGAPVTVTVPLALNDNENAIATKIASALQASTTLNAKLSFAAAGNVVTAKVNTVSGLAVADDATLAIATAPTAAGTLAGAAPFVIASTHGTAGVAGIPGTQATSVIPQAISGTDANQVAAVTITPVGTAVTNATNSVIPAGVQAYREWDVTVTSNGNANKGLIYLDLGNLYVPSSANGTLPVEIEAAPGSALSSGKIDVATVGTGVVTVTADNIKSITTGTNKPIGDIRIKEDRAGALKTGKALKVKLPKGFKWNSTGTASVVWGDNRLTTIGTSVNTTEDSRTLTLTLPAGVTATNAPTYLALTGATVDIDDSEAVAGPVEATLSGDSSLANGTVVVANYGDYGSSFAVSDATTVNAGVDDQKIGKITIQETAPGTLTAGRTIKLTLDGKAKWNPASLPQIDTGLSDLQGATFTSNVASLVGTDGKTVQFTVNTPSNATATKGAKIVLSTNQGTIDVAADAGDQDITVTAAGSAGVTGQGVVAKAIAPVDLTVDQPKDLRIGVQDQEIGDLVLQEKAAGALDNKSGTGRELTLKFPSGTAVSYPSKVEVVEGDVSLDLSAMSKNGNVLTIPVKSTSTKPAKIKISGLKLNVDRTVSEGPLKVEVGGGSLIKTLSQFPGSTYVIKPVVANVVTAAPTDTTAQNIVFKLNSKTFTVNGKEVTMDAAPLVAWDRAFLPVRFAANALNVSDDNIIWDDKTDTATIFKGDRVITAKVGDKFLTVNGAKVPMDVPVYRSAATNNRVMIPVRYLSNALGANIQWNQETSEITIGVK